MSQPVNLNKRMEMGNILPGIDRLLLEKIERNELLATKTATTNWKEVIQLIY